MGIYCDVLDVEDGLCSGALLVLGRVYNIGLFAPQKECK